MRKGKKVYKKVLSCVLAAAMVVTSGVVFPGNGKTACAVSIVQKGTFFDTNGKAWRVIEKIDGVEQDGFGAELS